MPYITSAEYTTYANERGIHVNNGHLAQDIILSADFIDTYYKFKGEPLSPTQPNKLPTDQVSIADIKKAALKACEMQQAGLLTLDLAAIAGGIVSSESKSLDGVGSKSVTYEAGSRNTYKRSTPQLDLLLRPFLAVSGGLVRG
jgi:hypothetical protein